MAVAVVIGAEEENGDHLFDLRLVEGRVVQELLLVIDVVAKATGFGIVLCLGRPFVISVGNRVILPEFVLRGCQQQRLLLQ